MPVYEVLLHGQGLTLLDEDGNEREGGVYVWRAVSAEDETSAAALARKDLLNDPVFTDEIGNDSVDALAFEVDEIREKSSGEEGNATAPVFYIEDDD